MGRVLALDVGDVRIGLAVSDLMGIIANPLETYNRKELSADVDYIVKLAGEKVVHRAHGQHKRAYVSADLAYPVGPRYAEPGEVAEAVAAVRVYARRQVGPYLRKYLEREGYEKHPDRRHEPREYYGRRYAVLRHRLRYAVCAPAYHRAYHDG